MACKPVIKKDSGCTQFLLPYILVHVICHGTQMDRDEVVSELEAIIGKDEAVDYVTTLNGSILSEQATHAVSQDLGNLLPLYHTNNVSKCSVKSQIIFIYSFFLTLVCLRKYFNNYILMG